MNAHIRRTFYLFAAGFVALVGILAYWQVYMREELLNDPANGLQTRKSVESPRGLILAGDGETVLARSESREEGGSTVYDRVYPQGPLYANTVGYWSPQYGATGIEVGENTALTATGEPETLDELINQISGGPTPGNNVELTLDPELQRIAYEGLAATSTGRGAAVALNPKTGEILALVSHPSYDPNNIDQRFSELQSAPDSPLINRATQGLYPPGSTFKVITSSAALEDGMEPSREFFDDGTYETPGYTVRNYKNEDHGRVTFTRALVLSINAVFAEIGVDIVGAERLGAMAREFGFGDDYEDFPLPVAQSDTGPPPEEWLPGYTAQVAFGQGEVVSNVFEMALVAGTVANNGTMMQPYLVKEVRSPDGVILDRAAPGVRREVLSAESANELNRMMQAVVVDGWLTQAQLGSVQVAGKTGTAEAPPDSPHSWWITFAPAEDPEIAIAVMVENGGVIDDEGNAATPAIPIATNMMAAHLDVEPAPVPSQRPEPQQQRPAQQQLPDLQRQQPGQQQQRPGQTPFQSPGG